MCGHPHLLPHLFSLWPFTHRFLVVFLSGFVQLFAQKKILNSGVQLSKLNCKLHRYNIFTLYYTIKYTTLFCIFKFTYFWDNRKCFFKKALNTWLVFTPFLQEVSTNVLFVKANEFRPTVLIMLQKLATFILLFFLIKDIQGGLHFRDLKASDVSILT